MGYGPIVATIKVASIKKSLEFYTGSLDFQLKWSWSNESQFEESDHADFACIECGAAVLFLSENSGGTESWLFVEFPFVEDVDEVAAQLTGSAHIEQLPADQPWGSREFLIQDPDGHHLRLSCPLGRVKSRTD